MAAVASEGKKETSPGAGGLPTTMHATYSCDFIAVGKAPAVVADAPVPEVKPGFLLIRNLAASLNPVDKYIGAGYFAQRSSIFGKGRSFGSDFAGVVVGVGAGATVTFLADDGTSNKRAAQVGDLVFGDGIQGTGSFAEFVAVVSSQAVIKPAGLTFAEAASLPLAGLTAFQAFTKHAAMPVGKGSKVLILGGTGGVGSLAIQIAKQLGATVAATGSNTKLLTSLGADIAINYREEDWGQKLAGQDFDLVFATVNDAKPTPAALRALKVLSKTGSFLYLLDAIKAPDGTDVGDRTFKFFLTDSTDGDSLAKIGSMASSGAVKAVFSNGKQFQFSSEGWHALMDESNSGRAKGKLVMNLV